jgi:pimeloyl-ACP methyl ester carboxylesterase
VLRLEPEPGTANGRVLVFLPGFLSAAASYRMLLEPLTAHGISVVVPQLYRRGPAVLVGRFTVEDEARAAAALVRGEAGGRGDRLVVLGGHSRGGQAAWRAANLLAADGAAADGPTAHGAAADGPTAGRLPAALVLVDPVDGAGRRPDLPTATADPVAFTCPCLVVGAGISGRCAPEPVNHRVFAAAAPNARHVIVDAIGHGDVLDDRPAATARRLCGGAPDPTAGRAKVTALITDLVLATTPMS